MGLQARLLYTPEKPATDCHKKSCGTLLKDNRAINETIKIMKQINEVITAHGGWPDAFILDKS